MYMEWAQAAVQQHHGTITRDPQYLAELNMGNRSRCAPAKYKYKNVPTKGVGDIYQNETLSWLVTTKHQLRALLCMETRAGCQAYLPNICKNLAQAAKDAPSSNQLVGKLQSNRDKLVQVLYKTSESQHNHTDVKQVLAYIEDSIHKHVQEQKKDLTQTWKQKVQDMLDTRKGMSKAHEWTKGVGKAPPTTH